MRLKGVFPARQKALEFITDGIKNSTWKQGTHLPSIRLLSKMAGVSLVTMVKAIQQLKKDGVLSGDGFQRSWVGHHEPAAANSGTPKISWEQKKALFERDIASGAFGLWGRIPSVKELQAKYGSGFRTMQKILFDAKAQGMIRPSGKGYVLSGTEAKNRNQKIVYITSLRHYSQNSALNHEHNLMVNLFENACLRMGMQIEIVEVDFYNPAASRKAAAGLLRDESIAGYILDVWWWAGQTYRGSYIDLLTAIASFNKPLSILDEIGTFELPLVLASNPRLQVFTFERKRSGERMARFLFDLGHRSVVFINGFAGDDWAQDRCTGVTTHFSRAGFESGVHLVEGPANLVNMPEMLSTAGLKDDEIRRLFASGRSTEQAKSLEMEWQEFRKNGVKDPLYSDKRFLKNLINLRAILNAKFDRMFFDGFSIAAFQKAGEYVFNTGMKPLFSRALGHTEATAWICANDETALSALSFLGEKNIPVPRDLSVTGFDNIPSLAIKNRLTTFDFNAAGFVSNMLNFIIRPPRPRGLYRHQTIEVEGIIITRETAGKINKDAREY
jgi:DNA-binding LacI/PurR family transcriptional regulator/DNA-binding transcriptional regulator YhcF (GntR family)